MNRQDHWEAVYAGGASDAFSWYQTEPTISLGLIGRARLALDAPILDIGGGDSALVDRLLQLGYTDVTVLDISELALERARKRLGSAAESVHWIAADVTGFQPRRNYALWHDRAVFHFLTDRSDRRHYVEALNHALAEGGHLVISTFAPDGPQKCSGLEVRRYSAASLAQELGPALDLAESLAHVHLTPGRGEQSFVCARFTT